MNWLQLFLLLGVGWIVYHLYQVNRHLSSIERLLEGQINYLARIDAGMRAHLKGDISTPG